MAASTLMTSALVSSGSGDGLEFSAHGAGAARHLRPLLNPSGQPLPQQNGQAEPTCQDLPLDRMSPQLLVADDMRRSVLPGVPPSWPAFFFLASQGALDAARMDRDAKALLHPLGQGGCV